MQARKMTRTLTTLALALTSVAASAAPQLREMMIGD